MKIAILKALALVALVAAPAAAEAATRGFSTANVNMRSGPSTAYPAVVVIPNGAPVTIHGCLQDRPWCDVSFDRGRGWVSANYVQAGRNRYVVEPRRYRELGVPIITFELGRYWDQHYRGRNFYGERERWRRPPPRGGYWDAAPPPRGRDAAPPPPPRREAAPPPPPRRDAQERRDPRDPRWERRERRDVEENRPDRRRDAERRVNEHRNNDGEYRAKPRRDIERQLRPGEPCPPGRDCRI